MNRQHHIIAKASGASPDSRRKKMKQWTFQKLAQTYLSTRSRRGLERNETARRVIKEMVARWGDRDLGDISRADIFEYQGYLQHEKNLSNATVNCYLTYLRAMMNFAMDELELKFAPPRIKLLEENKRTNYLEPDEVRRLIRALDPLRADMAEFAFHTGLRNNNVRLLRWEYVRDLAVLDIPASEMKNGKPLCIPLNKDAQKILRRRRNEKEDLQFTCKYVGKIDHVFFQDNGKPLSQKAVCNGTWRKAVKIAGLPPGTSFHTLRHTFASMHIKAGTQAVELKELGSWSSLNSIARYTHLGTDRKREVVNRLQGLLQP